MWQNCTLSSHFVKHTHTHISVLRYQMACLNTLRWQIEPFLHVVTMGTHHHTHKHTHQIPCHWLSKVCTSSISPWMLNMRTNVSAGTAERQQVTVNPYYTVCFSCFPLTSFIPPTCYNIITLCSPEDFGPGCIRDSSGYCGNSQHGLTHST